MISSYVLQYVNSFHIHKLSFSHLVKWLIQLDHIFWGQRANYNEIFVVLKHSLKICDNIKRDSLNWKNLVRSSRPVVFTLGSLGCLMQKLLKRVLPENKEEAEWIRLLTSCSFRILLKPKQVQLFDDLRFCVQFHLRGKKRSFPLTELPNNYLLIAHYMPGNVLTLFIMVAKKKKKKKSLLLKSFNGKDTHLQTIR